MTTQLSCTAHIKRNYILHTQTVGKTLPGETMPNESYGDGVGVGMGWRWGMFFLKIPKRANKFLKCICTAMYCISSQ